MDKEEIPVMTVPIYNSMLHYLEQSKALLCLARENISLSEQLASSWLSKGSKRRRSDAGRRLLASKKALKVSLSEIDKLIKRIELDCEDFLGNSILDDDTDEVTNE